MANQGGWGQGRHGPPAVGYGRIPHPHAQGQPQLQPAQPYIPPAHHRAAHGYGQAPPRHLQPQQAAQHPASYIAPAAPHHASLQHPVGQDAGWRSAAPPVQMHQEDAIDQVAKGRVYEQLLPAEMLHSDVVRLRAYDKTIETKRAIWGWLSVLGAIFTVASPFVMTDHMDYSILAALPGLFVTSVLFLVHRGYHKKDLEDRRYELSSYLTEMVANDMDPRSPLAVRLNLAPVEQKEKLVDTVKGSPWTVETFWDPWLWLRGTLLDGTKFDLVVGERMRKRSGWTTGSSGKSKHKVKRKSKHYITLKLAPKAKKHPFLAQVIQQYKKRPQLPPHVVVKGLQSKKGMLILKASSSWDWNEVAPDTNSDTPRLTPIVAAMFLSLYQLVGLSARIAKKKTGMRA